eukprot:1457160-Alexandrium_andersonii.AAC.1
MLHTCQHARAHTPPACSTQHSCSIRWACAEPGPAHMYARNRRGQRARAASLQVAMRPRSYLRNLTGAYSVPAPARVPRTGSQMPRQTTRDLALLAQSVSAPTAPERTCPHAARTK